MGFEEFTNDKKVSKRALFSEHISFGPDGIFNNVFFS